MSADRDVLVNVVIGGRPVEKQGFSSLVCIDSAASLNNNDFLEFAQDQDVRDAFDNGYITTEQRDALIDAFSEDFLPDNVLAGTRDGDQAQTEEITINAAGGDGTVWEVELEGNKATYTEGAGETTSDVAQGLGNSIDNVISNNSLDITTPTYPGSGDVITVQSSVAGKPFDLSETDASEGDMSIAETQANISIYTELTRLKNVRDDWLAHYEITTDEQDHIRAARWADEQDFALHLYQISKSNHTDVYGSGSNDVASKIKASYSSSIGVAHEHADEHPVFAWASAKLALSPDQGSTSWRHYTLNSATPMTRSEFSSTEQANLDDKNVNYYTKLRGVGDTRKGRTSGGDPIDLLITKIWVKARVGEKAAAKFLDASNRNSKIPYTEDGINVLREAPLEVGKTGQNLDDPHFRDDVDDAIVVDKPDILNIPTDDVVNRKLALGFEFKVAGAIEEFEVVRGVVSVDPG